VVTLPLLGLLALTAGMLWEGGAPVSPLRHLFAVPALWVALTAGAKAGSFIGIMAGLLQAPLVLPAIERIGLGETALEGLVSLVSPALLGVVAGHLRDQARGRARRLDALLELQRRLASGLPLAERLEAVVGVIHRCLGAHAVGLVLAAREGGAVVASVPPGAALAPGSAAAWSLATGETVRSRDLGDDARIAVAGAPPPSPVRAAVLPLDSGDGPAGVLAVEWRGEVSEATAAAAVDMALHLSLGIENARLVLRQQRFAAELEDKVQTATQRLREVDRAKSEFISVVSHELRTPITALEGFSELLLSRPVAPERAARFLGHIHTESRRLGRIVTELLDLSRLEAGIAPTLRLERVDLGAHVERQIELFAGAHPRHRFSWLPPRPRPTLHADADALDRMLQNLLSNAVKYSPRGGRVTVRARAVETGQIALEVEDQGVGIAPEALPRLFERYVRIANPETATVRGLGLGLNLVRALVEAHGGRVEVESEPGRGSRFRLILPAGSEADSPDFPPS
jgi:signal transduction histidine kinase